jgi:hypothetical protein
MLEQITNAHKDLVVHLTEIATRHVANTNSTLLPHCLPLRLIDPLLPARSVGLEIIQHVTVDAQRHISVAMRGLDPCIHDERSIFKAYDSPKAPHSLMDCRVKPGNDSGEVVTALKAFSARARASGEPVLGPCRTLYHGPNSENRPL